MVPLLNSLFQSLIGRKRNFDLTPNRLLISVSDVSIPNREKEKFRRIGFDIYYFCGQEVSIPNREKEKFRLVLRDEASELRIVSIPNREKEKFRPGTLRPVLGVCPCFNP